MALFHFSTHVDGRSKADTGLLVLGFSIEAGTLGEAWPKANRICSLIGVAVIDRVDPGFTSRPTVTVHRA